jgi:predicted DNA binding CopG/RHH family protein
VNLGLSKKEFLAMSPKEFYAMNKCYQERMEYMDWHMAGLKSFYANSNGLKITAEEFMGKRSRVTIRRSNNDLERDLVNLFGCGPGKE